MQIFIERAISNKDLLYYGTGNRTQDFTSIDNIFRAVSLCIIKKKGGVFNKTEGNPISMKELARIVIKNISGCKSKVLPAGVSDPQENYRSNFYISKPKEELGWEPKISLEKGLRKTINWYEQKRRKQN